MNRIVKIHRILIAAAAILLFALNSFNANAQNVTLTLGTHTQADIQAALNTPGATTVTVVGSDSGGQLAFDIPAGVTLVWEADFSGSPASSNHLISITGNGALVIDGASISRAGTGSGSTISVGGNITSVTVTGGSIISRPAANASSTGSTLNVSGSATAVTIEHGWVTNMVSGNAINASGANTTVTVTSLSGSETGVVEAATGTAIHGSGASTTVTVTGYGSVYNDATSNTQPVINITANTGPSVFVSGNATVWSEGTGDNNESLGRGYAIQTIGNVEVSGGKVESRGDNGRAINLVGSNSTATISGGTVEAVGTNGVAISTATANTALVESASVLVTGTAVVRSEGSHAIRTTGANSAVTVSGGTVYAETGSAVHAQERTATIRVNGGFVFAYGTAVTGANNTLHIVNNTPSPVENPAVAVAWSNTANPGPFVEFSSTGLSVSPAGATAVWKINEDGKPGIQYANSTNTGFIEIDVNIVPATGYGLIFDTATEQFYLDTDHSGTLNAGDIEYTGQAEKWEWTLATTTLELNDFEWETPAQRALTIIGNITLDINGVNTFSSINSTVDACALFSSSNIIVEGTDTLNLSADNDAPDAIAMDVNAFNINGGTVNASATASGGTGYSRAIRTSAGMTVYGGTVNAHAKGGIGSHGLIVTAPNGEITLVSGTINAFAENATTDNIGITTPTLTINGGVLTAQGNSNAIFASPTDPTVTPPTEYTYWINTAAASDPSGNGIKSTATAYSYSSADKYVKIQEGITQDLTISGAVGGWTYTGGVLTITQNGDYTIGMVAGVTTATDHIVVQSGLTDVNIVLNGVNIDGSLVSPPACAFSMIGATVNLTLSGTNTLISGYACAGIQAPAGSTLTINGSATDVLTATGGTGAAGIGGDDVVGSSTTAGTITITGGNITANGGDQSAGIGGGAGGAGGNILIYGENTIVTATAGAGGGEDIGAGDGGAAGNVFVALTPASLQNSSSNIGNEVLFSASPTVNATVTADLPAPFSQTINVLTDLTSPKTMSVITTVGTNFKLTGYPDVPKTGTALMESNATVAFVITATAASTTANIPTLNPAGLVFLVLLLAGIAFRQRRRNV
jgi:hypothetical protein